MYRFNLSFNFKFLFLILILFLTALSPAFADENNSGNKAENAVKSLNNFALKSAKFLNDEAKGGAFFFSPYSIISALGMTYAGADGATKNEYENVLLFNPEIHAALGSFTAELTRELDGENERPLLTSANRIWVKNDLSLRDKFVKILADDYNSSAAKMDFAKDSDGAKNVINEWVADNTNQRIKNLIQKIEPDTRMILTNAVYFNGKWAKAFNEKLTSEKPFYTSPDTDKDAKKEVKMMRRNDKMFYAERDGVKILNLPYMGRLSMILAMTSEPEVSVNSIIAKLSGENGAEIFYDYLKSLSKYQVDLWLPKFKTEKRYQLKDILSSLGLKNAFTNDANFSGMTEDEPLKIDSVIHQTFIEVDEKKTEAAAATAITMMRATAARPVELRRAEFHADRPFVYFIIDWQTKSILFMGLQNF